jgi:serum/glucocorticoid-regulated kinase 2
MSRGVVLDEFTAKFLIAQIILALEYLHSKNIIYRDLKPENITVGDDNFIKVIDFGLSKEIQNSDLIAKSFCGSPAYLSPEIITGQGTSKATDIYSVGTILYEMLTGYPPFFCNELKQLLYNIRYCRRI